MKKAPYLCTTCYEVYPQWFIDYPVYHITTPYGKPVRMKFVDYTAKDVEDMGLVRRLGTFEYTDER